MYLSVKWLKEFTPYDGDIDKLAHVLTMIGLEVEEILNPFEEIEELVVGYVAECEKHPNADKLKVCKVDIGKGELLPVVCGAPNVAKGQYVAFAPVGSTLPGGLKIKKAKLRGEISLGMICSERELGLSDDHSGIMVLDSIYEPGKKLVDALDLDTQVFDIGITPNRGDCLSVLGVAREVSAYFGLPLNLPKIEIEKIELERGDNLEIEIYDPEDCPMYAARIIEGVKVKQAPGWMKYRLVAMGLRPINNIVDVTNYVLLEFGHPLHAFDKDLLKGNKIRVARPDKKLDFKTLDGQIREITQDDLLIWDAENPVALAGIMGGYDSEINNNTKNVLLECAVFNPSRIRRTARKLGISSEAAYRFERGVDQLGADRAINRAAYLIARFGGGSILKGIIKNEPKKFQHKTILFRPKRAISFLCIDSKPEYCTNILTRLGCQITTVDEDNVKVIPPSFRLDLEREIDLVEEVGRIYGLEKVPATLPRISKSFKKLKVSEGADYNFLCKIKEWARGIGLQECITYSFVDKDELISLGEREENMVPVANPLSKDQDTMRTYTITGPLKAIRINLDRLNKDLHFFEVAKAFLRDEGCETGVREKNRLAIAIYGKREPNHWSSDVKYVDFYDIKGIIEHLFATLNLKSQLQFKRTEKYPFLDIQAEVYLDTFHVGFIGSLEKKLKKSYHVKNDVYLAEIFLDEIYQFVEKNKIKFKNWSKYPPVYRDMTIVCPEDLSYETIKNTLEQSKSKILEQINLIDLYTPKDKKEKRITLRMTYRHPEKTLTDKEVDKVHGELGKYILEKLPVRFP